jgi:hypothetical protein
MSDPRATVSGPPVSRAVVHACDTETRYLRTGRGSVMVLVAADLDRDDVLQTVTTLSREFLVLAAAPTLRDPASLARWLREFLECLGVADAHVVLHVSASAILTGESIHA